MRETMWHVTSTRRLFAFFITQRHHKTHHDRQTVIYMIVLILTENYISWSNKICNVTVSVYFWLVYVHIFHFLFYDSANNTESLHTILSLLYAIDIRLVLNCKSETVTINLWLLCNLLVRFLLSSHITYDIGKGHYIMFG